ncbi:T9SS type A sorting domain-containing protein [Kaistella flava (ex Peng et al. 2021)]|uniref:T9SS type A sorting domain-containing protein n=1 Tax=Kaistella flava (ex Peng et al. 2021) TaxID=2038776 RepID=A0A7M2Y6T2_9FLAO|nr:T9SS type A sorting domain-containing protein [Kaistella flava (ex Peng et al. 2021)]QOW09958.1 T9SS type A sorting domain-containing protein [Kaistella flava (ex Peng et al. 2021)]
MKKIYFLLFTIVSFICYSQPYSSLLKNANWTIMKIQWNGIDYYPPAPFVASGKVEFNYDGNNGFRSILFNSAFGTAAFGDNNSNYFNVPGIAITLMEYHGENEQAVQQFDNMTTDFYFGFQPTDKFYFDYQEIFSGKNLTVTNPLGNKIFYSNLILANSEASLNKRISISPNPAKDEFFIKASDNILGKVSVEIYENSGKLVSSQNVSFTDAVNTQALPNGMYQVKVTGLGVNYSSKLLIKK